MLLEVLVSLVILVLGLGAVFSGASIGVNAVNDAAQQERAAVAAQSLITELGHTRTIRAGTSEGDFQGGEHWKLVLSKVPTENAGPQSSLEGFIARLDVNWERNRRPQRLEFETLVIRPPDD